MRNLLAAAFPILVLATGSVRAQETKPADPVRETIARAIEWIAQNAVSVGENPPAVMFRETAEATVDPASGIYGGTAGVLIFLENAAAVLGDERARSLADATFRGLATMKRDAGDGNTTWARKGKVTPAGLYLGDAGVGQAFLIRARLRNDADARAQAVAAADSVIARGKSERDTLHWGTGGVDIIFGEAGTLLFLLDVAKETGEKKYLDAAAATARWLVEKATVEKGTGTESRPRRLKWLCPMVGNRHMPNFSHGTAGVAYALARAAAATGDAQLAQAAKDGAAWLIDHAIQTNDQTRWPNMEGSKSCMGGWCHGPPGTARLFLLLYEQTGDRAYLDVATSAARWLMSYGGADSRKEPPAGLNPSLCCGVAGVLDFFCDLYRVTKKKEYAEFAARAGDYLIRAAKPDGKGVKWVNGASSHSDTAAQHGIDLMLGASGEAFALLRLTTLEQEVDPIRHLPDRAVVSK